MKEHEICLLAYVIFTYIFNFISIAYYTRNGLSQDDAFIIAFMVLLFSPFSILLTLFLMLRAFFAWLFPK